MSTVSVSTFDWKNVKGVMLALCLLFGGCNYLVRLSASGFPGVGNLAASPNILGAALTSLNIARISAGNMLSDSTAQCPVFAQQFCWSSVGVLKVVFGLNP